MADRFIDDRAREDEAEEADEFEGLPEDEPEASGGSKGDKDSDDEEDEEEANEEDANFLADENEDDSEGEGGEDADQEERRKKKKRRRKDLVLEEEDYELLEENTGIRQVRPQALRRLKKARDVTGPSGRLSAAEQLQNELFGADGAEGLEDDIDDRVAAGGAPARDGHREEDRDFGGGGDDDLLLDEDEDDWIVNEFEEEGVQGARPGRQRRRRTAGEGHPDIDPQALGEANDIFGNVDELLEMYHSRKRENEAEEDLEEDAEDLEGGDAMFGDEEGSEDEERAVAALERRRRAAERSTEANLRKLREQLEPGAMERHFMMPADERIRAADLPEREQLTRGIDPLRFDLDECARWVHAELLASRSMYVKARDTLEDGAREVEGPPPAWMGISEWRKVEPGGDGKGDIVEYLLRDDLLDTRSHRGFFQGRTSSHEREDWADGEAVQEALKESIRAALGQLYEAHEEVPVLGMYRKELLGELLSCRGHDEPAERDWAGGPEALRGVITASQRRARRWDVLWAVHRLAQRWRALQRLKEARTATLRQALAAAAPGSDEAEAIQACLDMVPAVRSIEQLDDLEAKYQMAVPAPEESLAALDLSGEGGHQARRRRRATPHQLALRAGLGDASRPLGISAAQFAENMEVGYKRHEALDLSESPQEMAQVFVDASHPARRDVAAVLRSATLIAAAEIAAQPVVRNAVREYFLEHVVVSTTPTDTGDATLNPFHPLGIAKRLLNKPLRRFHGSDTFLKVLEAEKAGLITMRMTMAEKKNLVDALPKDLYLSSGVSAEAQEWNKLREEVLREAVTSGLRGTVEREARTRLSADARACVLQDLSDKLWELASQAPLRMISPDDESEVVDKRVMAVCYGNGSGAAPTTIVVLDPSGALVDFLHCPQLSGAIPRPRIISGQTYDMFTDPKKAKDATAIREFIESHLPHAIVVGVGHAEALTLRDDVKNIIDRIMYDNPRFFTTLETGAVDVVVASEAVAALWEHSAAAKEEMRQSPPIVRRTVALGRQLIDPLAVLAAVCAPASKEVLSLPLHPLQSVLGEEERLRTVEEVLSSAAAQVGVDLNAAAATPWLAPPLAFVPGLGPRKAQALLRAVARAGGAVESRRQLAVEMKNILGETVFRNAAPFLRVRASSKAASNMELEVLDDTRVHPESYDLAVAIAQSAAPGAADDVAVETAMAAPREVEALELDAYDAHLRQVDAAVAEGEVGEEENGPPGPTALRGSTRLATLIDVQMELAAPYGELRRKHESLGEDEIFFLASGEDKSTLKVGRRVEAKIRYVSEQFARCVVPELNGMEAVINADSVSSKSETGEGVDCRHYFKSGDAVVAVVKRVDPKERVLELGTSSKLLNKEWETAYLKDQDRDYALPTKEEMDRKAAEERERRRAAARAAFVKRPIRHPLFKNVGVADATNAVLPVNRTATEAGAAVIRPSKTARSLFLTVRIPGDLVWHVEIKEKGKLSADLRLAPPLAVEPFPGRQEEYDDLDEFVARFVEPISSALRNLSRHRKWGGGGGGAAEPQTWEQVQAALAEARAAAPNTAAYCFAADDRRPGAFYLAFHMGSRPRREFFVVVPEGYYFRKKTYSNLDKLLQEFKRQPLPQEEARARAAAAAAQAAQLQEAQYQQQQQFQQQQAQYQQQQQYYQQGYYGPTMDDPYSQQQQYPPPQQYPQQGGYYGR